MHKVIAFIESECILSSEGVKVVWKLRAISRNLLMGVVSTRLVFGSDAVSRRPQHRSEGINDDCSCYTQYHL